MSRIHEALRRAAEEHLEPGRPALEVALPVEGDPVATLSGEPFPDERVRPAPKAAAPPAESLFPKDEARGEVSSPFERIDARLAEKVVADEKISPVAREQYRRIAGALLDAQNTNGLHVIMVASAVPGEGKTLTASNLALTLSESYRRRVLLIDADLRKPAVHEVFRLHTVTGLIEGLEKNGKLVVRQVTAHLSVLPAGRPTTDPMAALTSQRMRQLLTEAREAFDFVIIDTPPLLLLPDAHLLSSLVDGAVLVVKAGSTPHAAAKRTVEIIGRERVLGVVLNQAEARDQLHYGQYYGGQYLTTTGGPKGQ